MQLRVNCYFSSSPLKFKAHSRKTKADQQKLPPKGDAVACRFLQPHLTVTHLEGWVGQSKLGVHVACPWYVPVDGRRGDKSCEIEAW